MLGPLIKQFDTERQLTDYADKLNEAGVTPEIPIMDSAGNAALATLQAPGGDGWGFAYYGINEPDDGRIQGEDDGGWVVPRRYIGEGPAGAGWEPTWPVFGLIEVEGMLRALHHLVGDSRHHCSCGKWEGAHHEEHLALVVREAKLSA